VLIAQTVSVKSSTTVVEITPAF